MHTSAAPARRAGGRLEIVVAALIGLAAVVGAYATLRAERAEHKATIAFDDGVRTTTAAGQAATAGNQTLQGDQQLFLQYAAAREAGHRRLVRYIYSHLMGRQLRAGVRWWLGHAEARSPFAAADRTYQIPALDRSAALSRRSARLVQLGQSKQELADRYQGVEVVVAGALLLLGLGGVLPPGRVRPTAVALGAGVLVAGLVLLATA
jgi:hypothetical protein